VSMMVPMAGGLVWAHFGVQWVFAGAATIALLNLAAACFIPPLPQSRPAPAVETVN